MTFEFIETIKSWGREVLLECNDKYAFKEITLKKGKRTSLQYHKRKKESGYVVSGLLELEYQIGKEMLKRKLEHGGCYTISPKMKHRMRALVDSVYVEASTPELDDVVRIEDDYGRA